MTFQLEQLFWCDFVIPVIKKTWDEFAEIYTPLIVAFCQKYQLQHTDIADIV